MSQDPKADNGKAAREARLAQALRTNLRRRKAAPAKPETSTGGEGTSSD